MSGFKKIYPGNERQLLDGGLNTKFKPSIIEGNESPDCLNVVFTNGVAGTRPGIQKFNTTPIGSFTVDGLYTRRANDTSETMCAFANGAMWATAGGTTFTVVASSVSAWTAGTRIATAQYQNYMFIGNGSATPYKYNGSTFTRHGVPAPTTTSTVGSAGVAGNLTASAQYRYKVTYVNSALVESDLGPATTTFTISTTSGQNTLSVLPTAPQSFGVNQRYLYRTSGSGSTFYRLATLADNTTTTYTDNTADTSLGVVAPSDNGVPANYSAIIYHQNRLFFNDPTNPNYVWWTNLNEPYTVASTNFERVGDNTTDIVKGFAVDNNNLVVFCENSVTVGFMSDTTDSNWKWIKSKSPYGSKSPFGAFKFGDKTGFPAVQNNKFVGIAGLVGDAIEPSATILTGSTVKSDMKTEKVETDMFNVQENFLGNISSMVFKNKAYISFPYSTGQTTNNRIYVMDFSTSNIKKHQTETWVPFTGINASQFTIYGGKLYCGSSLATGYIYQMESSLYSDDGTAIDSYIWTKEFVGDEKDTNFTKDFRYIKILVDNAGRYYMDITYRLDSDRGSGNTVQINLDPGGSLWGVMVWGVDLWGGGTNQKEFREFLANARGQRIQFKFSNQNTADQRFAVHGLNFLYNLKGYR